MFTLKILNGPLTGFEMALSNGDWHLYTYVQEEEAAQLRVVNNINLASENVIFIPLFERVTMRHIQLQLDSYALTCLCGWADDPAGLKPVALQQRLTIGPLHFALKPHQDNWAIIGDNVTHAATKNHADGMPAPVHTKNSAVNPRHLPFFWLVGGFLLMITAFILSNLLLQQPETEAIPPQTQLTLALQQSIKHRLTQAGIVWLTLGNNNSQNMMLTILTNGQDDGAAQRAEQVLRQAYPQFGTVVVKQRTFQALQDELRALFLQAGVPYHQVMTSTGVYVAVRQSLTIETLDYLNHQLQAFYQRWGQERVHISIQYPVTYDNAPLAVLQRGQEQLIWDRSNHIFQTPTPISF